MKVCPSCGKSCSDTEFYCSNCGFPMNNAPVSAEPKQDTDTRAPILPPVPSCGNMYSPDGLKENPTPYQNSHPERPGYGRNPYESYNNQYADYRQNPYHQYMYFSYYPQEIRRKTDPFSITSFVVSLSSLLIFYCSPLGFIGGIIGLIFGILSIKRIRDPRRFFSGRGFAITGIIVSSLILVACFIGLFFILLALSTSSYPSSGPSWSL